MAVETEQMGASMTAGWPVAPFGRLVSLLPNPAFAQHAAAVLGYLAEQPRHRRAVEANISGRQKPEVERISAAAAGAAGRRRAGAAARQAKKPMSRRQRLGLDPCVAPAATFSFRKHPQSRSLSAFVFF